MSSRFNLHAPKTTCGPGRRHFLAITSAAAAGMLGLLPGSAQAKGGGGNGALLDAALGKSKDPKDNPPGLALGHANSSNGAPKGIGVGLGGDNPGKAVGLGGDNPGKGGIPISSPGGPGGQGPFCLARGTAVATPDGERFVEDLRTGDLVRTLDDDAPVRWIGRFTYPVNSSRPNLDTLPIRIARFALDDGTPRRDLYVSPAHGLFIDGYVIPAKDLVNGTTISYADPEVFKSVDYFHILLDAHEVIFAEGAPVETMLIGAGPEHEALRGMVAGPMSPVAPNIGYEGGRAHMQALLRLGMSPFIDLRDPLQRVYDRLMARAVERARSSAEVG